MFKYNEQEAVAVAQGFALSQELVEESPSQEEESLHCCKQQGASQPEAHLRIHVPDHVICQVHQRRHQPCI